MVFVLSPASLASTVCGEELRAGGRAEQADRPGRCAGRSTGCACRPRWNGRTGSTRVRRRLRREPRHARRGARARRGVARRSTPGSRSAPPSGSGTTGTGATCCAAATCSTAERWLDEQAAHREPPTAEQATYITREPARRGAAPAGAARGRSGSRSWSRPCSPSSRSSRAQTAIDREQTARAQARAAQSIAALVAAIPRRACATRSRPSRSARTTPEARVRAAAAPSSTAGWTSILRLPESARAGAARRRVLARRPARRDRRLGRQGRASGTRGRGVASPLVTHAGRVHTVQFSPDGRQLLTAAEDGTAQDLGHRDRPTAARRSTRVAGRVGRDLGRRRAADPHRRRRGRRGLGRGDRRPARGGCPTARGDYRGTIRMSLDGRRALTGGDGRAPRCGLGRRQRAAARRRCRATADAARRSRCSARDGRPDRDDLRQRPALRLGRRPADRRASRRGRGLRRRRLQPRRPARPAGRRDRRREVWDAATGGGSPLPAERRGR